MDRQSGAKSGREEKAQSRKLTEDQKRDTAVYRFLLSLTDLDLSDEGSELPNETSIAKQWGLQNNRIFVRRVLRSVLFKELYEDKKDEKKVTVPGLTLSKLVGILSSLQSYKRENQSLDAKQKASALLTRADKFKALSLFFQLSPIERDTLKMKLQGEALLREIYEKASDATGPYEKEDINRLYDLLINSSKDIGFEKFDNNGPESQPAYAIEKTLRARPQPPTMQGFIRQTVSDYARQYLQGLSSEEEAQRINAFIEQVEREIDRIELQSGIEQMGSFLPGYGEESKSQRLNSYLLPAFVKRLIYSVIDNELLTDEFPVHIKYFKIERVKPLPLRIKDEKDSDGLLNSKFLEGRTEPNQLTPRQLSARGSSLGLERQVAYKVRVHFYIKVPKNYKIQFEETATEDIDKQTKLEFSEEVVGIGSPISHIIAVIDRVLLWDIPALKDYISVVENVRQRDEVIGTLPNSPVWSHCVVKLHQRKDVQAAIRDKADCADVATGIEVASANFCGFDLIETSAKAALYARLKLIKQALSTMPTVTKESYMEELCRRVEEVSALKKAKQRLSLYPFSLRAMEGEIKEYLIENDKYKKGHEKIASSNIVRWSSVSIEAVLSIAEANLKEGLVQIAKKQLDILQPYFERDEPDQVDELLQARYHLCFFRYYYLSDIEAPYCEMRDRYTAVRRASEELDKAERCLEQRLKYYDKLSERSLSNLNPQFYFLSRVYAHRAKLHIFFPDYITATGKEPLNKLIEPIKLLESARVYAARDGDAALYAQWSAYQSWCYIMLAYLTPEKAIPDIDGFSKEDCLDWARRLMKHAENCYSEQGKICYQQIKNNGGKETEYSCPLPRAEDRSLAILDDVVKWLRPAYDSIATRYVGVMHYEKYGDTFVQVAPLIQELRKEDGTDQKKNQTIGGANREFVKLQLDLLKGPLEEDYLEDEDTNSSNRSDSTYLFGMKSGILLFSKGMFFLCKQYDSEDDFKYNVRTKSMRMFQYCCAITLDGTRRIEEDNPSWPNWAKPGHRVFSRSVPDIEEIDDHSPIDEHWRDRLLQYLYPHRLTQFADLGKIFIVVCRLILIATDPSVEEIYSSSKSWNESNKLLKRQIDRVRKIVQELRENKDIPFDDKHARGQKRYNGHLVSHYEALDKYVESFIRALKDKDISNLNGIHIRDQIVTDVFRIIRGDVDVSPRV
ncbi:hypothetical protein [cf. Phormidesmis sp. LEGE 11477]|uniref:hypothetical protein n=1 Tax=cf. Phormidesmis sp. LEGE 11477 TaxID=1828680 RepID=UPI00188259ED|nr:hypothetical protein [cf. Phormidesmis sp. LEGE 11477]MBE9062834.1 hypothetical protein [cf. Phormidesmis sp. LEGE 11477]